jgi:hypothetical protein
MFKDPLVIHHPEGHKFPKLNVEIKKDIKNYLK